MHWDERPHFGHKKPRSPGKANGPFPKESPHERRLAGERQRQILEKELATEHELLALAKRELAEQYANANNGNQSTEALRPYVDNVELHEKNIAALRRELSRLYR